MTVSLTPEERELLAQCVEDGWPLGILGAGLDEQKLTDLQDLVRSLVRRGLVGIYGRPDDASDLPLAEAEAVIANKDEWLHGGTWFINTTDAGDAALEG